MKITMVTDKPVSIAPVARQASRKPIGNRISNQNGRPRANGAGPNRNRPGGNRPAGQQANKTKRPPATKEQLDADLDAYINKVGAFQRSQSISRISIRFSNRSRSIQISVLSIDFKTQTRDFRTISKLSTNLASPSPPTELNGPQFSRVFF